MHENFFVYVLTNPKRRVLYIGVTNDIQRRVWEHSESTTAAFARRYNLSLLLYLEVFPDPAVAIAREKQLKGWRRAKKIALIESQDRTGATSRKSGTRVLAGKV